MRDSAPVLAVAFYRVALILIWLEISTVIGRAWSFRRRLRYCVSSLQRTPIVLLLLEFFCSKMSLTSEIHFLKSLIFYREDCLLQMGGNKELSIFFHQNFRQLFFLEWLD